MKNSEGLFVCHSSIDSKFVLEVIKHLRYNFQEVFYFEDHQRADEGFHTTIDKAIDRCNYFLVFLGMKFSVWQKDEVGRALGKSTRPKCCVVYLKPLTSAPPGLGGLSSLPHLSANTESRSEAVRIAFEISSDTYKIPFRGIDGLPYDRNLFSYEKDIIDFYIRRLSYGNRLFCPGDLQPQSEEEQHTESYFEQVRNYRRSNEEELKEIEVIHGKLRNGCPSEWPEVVKWEDVEPSVNKEEDGGTESQYPILRHPLDTRKFGTHRDTNAHVIAATLSQYHSDIVNDRSISSSCLTAQRIFFPEAGPREKIFFPRQRQSRLKIGILVAGGIAPGINAVIDGIVQRHTLYAKENNYTASVYGIQNGLYAVDFDKDTILDDTEIPLISNVTDRDSRGKYLVTSEYASLGGSVIGTSRVDELILASEDRERYLKSICNAFRSYDILYVIGGDGSMKLSHALWYCANVDKSGKDQQKLSVVAIPKTMDNDILWMWQAFGFLSAVEKAREIIGNLATEIKSNPRLCVLQLFGSDSGFVVSHAVAASSFGQCDAALIPEGPFSLYRLACYLKRRMCSNCQKVPSGLVVMAETAIPMDAIAFVFTEDIDASKAVHDLADRGISPEATKKDIEAMRSRMSVEDFRIIAEHVDLTEEELKEILKFHVMQERGERIQGQTNDKLRSAALKIVSRGLEKLLPIVPCEKEEPFQPNWHKLRVMTNEPRHILRAIHPTSSDIIMGQRLGTLAVDNAMAGYTDFMISQWLTEFVLVPLQLVVLGRKRIPQDGMFWKSVLSKTDQDANMEL